MEAFGGNIRDSIETPFRDLIGDSVTPNVPVLTGIVIMLHCDNATAARPAPSPTRSQARPPPSVPSESITPKRHFLKINATLPEKGRDLRLDLFRGVANWAIFLDHIPDNVVNWITTRITVSATPPTCSSSSPAIPPPSSTRG